MQRTGRMIGVALLAIGLTGGTHGTSLGADASTAPAQARPDDLEHARTFLVLRLTDELDLTDEQVLKVNHALKGIVDRQHALRTRRKDVEAKVTALLGKTPVDAAALEPLVKDCLAIDHELALLPEETTNELIGLLTVEQRARFVLIRPQLQREVRGQARAAERRSERRGGHDEND
jgi:Spy/CpxP family protein refolding chaperone